MIHHWYELDEWEERERELAELKARPGIWGCPETGRGGFNFPEVAAWWGSRGCQVRERYGELIVRYGEVPS